MADGKPAGFLKRKISLEWALVLVAVVLVTGFFICLPQTMRLRTQQTMHMSSTVELANESAEAIARSIAVFGNTRIVEGNWSDLQEYADEVVANDRLAYIAIVTPDQRAVVHTNRSFRGKDFTKPTQTRKVVHASVPAMSRTQLAATVWVGLYTGLPDAEQ